MLNDYQINKRLFEFWLVENNPYFYWAVVLISTVKILLLLSTIVTAIVMWEINRYILFLALGTAIMWYVRRKYIRYWVSEWEDS